ncbi:MAG: transposase [Bacteroidales bacterium]|nr:transposase [Bacteroidales bacterium]
MPEKFKNKYRISSARLQNWDYRWDGAYFITICTQNRENYFGNIVDGNMELSSMGIIADIMWHEIKNHARNVELDAFVVMPNHVHGILVLTGNSVETGHALSLPSSPPQKQPTTIGQKRFQNIGKNSISSIIGSYKSAVSKHTHRLGFDFQWQSRFHDHIIRDGKSFQNIRNYIFENPLNWQNDELK